MGTSRFGLHNLDFGAERWLAKHFRSLDNKTSAGATGESGKTLDFLGDVCLVEYRMPCDWDVMGTDRLERKR